MKKPYLPTRVIAALGHYHKVDIWSYDNGAFWELLINTDLQQLKKYMYVGDKAIKMTKQYINAELGYQRFINLETPE
tara:strand:+ start:610 stop:840 length:231 start_codon:yes stop_codon:yes gene_type:complete